jgi:hypothetical protein
MLCTYAGLAFGKGAEHGNEHDILIIVDDIDTSHLGKNLS